MNEFGFLNAKFAALEIVVLIMALIVMFSERTKAFRLSILGMTSKFSVRRPIVCFTILTVIVFALMRPYSGYEDVKLASVGSDILILADTSLSMLTRDTQPDRITVLKAKIRELLNVSRAKGFSDRYGIVTFAGDAYLFSPLTADAAVINSFTAALDSTVISSPGSDFKKALSTAVAAFKNAKVNSGDVVILSDGEEIGRDFSALSTELRKNNITVHAIGIGTIDGGPIPLSNGEFVKDRRGEIVFSKLFQENLAVLCKDTGGLYQNVSLSSEDVMRVLDKIHSKNLIDYTNEKVTDTRIYHELGPIILVLLLCAVVVTRGFLKYDLLIIVAYLLINMSSVYADEKSAYDAFKAYQAGDYKSAQEIFSKLAEENKKDADISQALGSTFYKLNNYAGAAREFQRAQELAKNGRSKFNSLYGLGNAQFMQQRFKDAINSYESALKIKPDDKDTLENLELARRLLQEQNKSSSSSSSSSSGMSDQSSSHSNSNESSQSSTSAEHNSSDSSSSEFNSESPSSDSNSSEAGQESEGSSANNSNAASSNISSQIDARSENDAESTASQGMSSSEDTMEKWLDVIEDSPLLPPKKQKRSKVEENEQNW